MSGSLERVRGDALELRHQLRATLADLARTMESAAGVAERIAERAVERGRADVAATERQAAKRARQVATRARAVARPLRRQRRP